MDDEQGFVLDDAEIVDDDAEDAVVLTLTLQPPGTLPYPNPNPNPTYSLTFTNGNADTPSPCMAKNDHFQPIKDLVQRNEWDPRLPHDVIMKLSDNATIMVDHANKRTLSASSINAWHYGTEKGGTVELTWDFKGSYYDDSSSDDACSDMVEKDDAAYEHEDSNNATPETQAGEAYAAASQPSQPSVSTNSGDATSVHTEDVVGALGRTEHAENFFKRFARPAEREESIEWTVNTEGEVQAGAYGSGV